MILFIKNNIGTYTLTVKLWAGGGAGGSFVNYKPIAGAYTSFGGGGGGFSGCELPTNALETFQVIVGGGGVSGPRATIGAGGYGGGGAGTYNGQSTSSCKRGKKTGVLGHLTSRHVNKLKKIVPNLIN